MNRIGVVDDTAYGVLFLAPDELPLITGSELVPDGGWAAKYFHINFHKKRVGKQVHCAKLCAVH